MYNLRLELHIKDTYISSQQFKEAIHRRLYYVLSYLVISGGVQDTFVRELESLST
jgi:hypothetical protein